MLRNPGTATASATRSIVPVKKKTARHPKTSPITPAPDAPSRLPLIAANNSRPIATCPLLYQNTVSGNGQRNRENAARGRASDHAQNHQRFEIRGEAAGKRRHADHEHAERDQPRLAEHVGKRAEHRLHERIGQGEAS